VARSLLHSQVDTYQDRNATVYFLLGMVSFSQRLMRDLRAEVGEPQPAPPLAAPRIGKPAGTLADNGFLYFMLGLISFSDQVAEVVQAEQARWAQLQETAEEPEAGAASALDLRGLLR
jgi:hypothetical protein